MLLFYEFRALSRSCPRILEVRTTHATKLWKFPEKVRKRQRMWVDSANNVQLNRRGQRTMLPWTTNVVQGQNTYSETSLLSATPEIFKIERGGFPTLVEQKKFKKTCLQ